MNLEQYKKIKDTKKLYQSFIDPWVAYLEGAKYRLDMEIQMLDWFKTMPDIDEIIDIEQDARLAQKRIRAWEVARDEKVNAIVSGNELEMNINNIF